MKIWQNIPKEVCRRIIDKSFKKMLERTLNLHFITNFEVDRFFYPDTTWQTSRCIVDVQVVSYVK